MSYRKELQDLIVRLRNEDLAVRISAEPPRFEFTPTWREQFDRWAEIIDFAINHPDEFKANLEVGEK